MKLAIPAAGLATSTSTVTCKALNGSGTTQSFCTASAGYANATATVTKHELVSAIFSLNRR